MGGSASPPERASSRFPRRARRAARSAISVAETPLSQRPLKDPDRLGTDSVDRQQLIPRVARHLFEARDPVEGELASRRLADFVREISDLPTVDVPKTRKAERVRPQGGSEPDGALCASRPRSLTARDHGHAPVGLATPEVAFGTRVLERA